MTEENSNQFQQKQINQEIDYENLSGFFAYVIKLDKKYNPHLYLDGKLKEDITKQNNDRHSDTNSSKTSS